MQGIVKWYDIRKGYGFIRGENGKDVFVHRSAVPFWTIYLNPGDKVEYSLKQTPQGIKATELMMLSTTEREQENEQR